MRAPATPLGGRGSGGELASKERGLAGVLARQPREQPLEAEPVAVGAEARDDRYAHS